MATPAKEESYVVDLQTSLAVVPTIINLRTGTSHIMETNMQSNIPAAIVGTQLRAVAPSIVTSFKKLAREQRNTTTDHVVYSIAKVLHYASNAKENIDVTAILLKKLIWANPPITKPSKLSNGNTPFQSLFNTLNVVRKDGGRSSSQLSLTEAEASEIQTAANEAYQALRASTLPDLLALAPKAPAPREKTPFVWRKPEELKN